MAWSSHCFIATVMLQSVHGTGLLPHGSLDCPCVDPYPIVDVSTNSTGCAGPMRGTECYPREYGSKGCRRYDSASSPECQGPTPPAWCNSLWCYVAPWNCLKPNVQSAFFPSSRMANATLLAEGGMNCSDDGTQCDGEYVEAAARAGRKPNWLMFSYQTCGNVDNFAYMDSLMQQLRAMASRGTLRISIPGDEVPYISTVGPNTTDYVVGTSPRRDGSIPRFVSRVLQKYSIAWEEVPISASSRAFSPLSSFTACIHDVALNNTDICAASTWVFESRARLAEFTVPIESVEMFVIAPVSQKATSFSELLLRPFKPFDWTMWLGMVGALVYAGYALYTLDASGHKDEERDDDFGATLKLEPLTASQKKQLKYAIDWRHAFCPTTFDDATDLGLSMIHSVQSFIGGGDFRHEPRTITGWIVFYGLSFLILVTISNYTAQVTAFSVLNSQAGTIQSLDEGLSRGYRFCGWASLQEVLEASYPRLKGLYVGLENGHDLFREMDRGKCDAGIIDNMAWEVAKSGVYSLPEDDSRYAAHANGASRWHCDTKIKLPAAVYNIDLALAVRSDLRNALSWAITKSKEKGEWQLDHNEAQRRLIKPSTCSATSEPDEAESLDFSSGAGAVFLSVGLTTIALVTNALWRMRPSQRAERADLVARHRRNLQVLASNSCPQEEDQPSQVTHITHIAASEVEIL
jgi:hypothetical protein